MWGLARTRLGNRKSVSASWLRREAVAGRVPSALIAGVRLYAVDALRHWLIEQTEQQRTTSANDTT